LVAESEDYAKFGIRIEVAFRIGQRPQTLDAFTQSGGVCLNTLFVVKIFLLLINYFWLINLGTICNNHAVFGVLTRFDRMSVTIGR
jgi:hypothetical protein